VVQNFVKKRHTPGVSSDNGKVGGAVLRARAAREENELTVRKLDANVSRELSRIGQTTLRKSLLAKDHLHPHRRCGESARTVRENVATGLISPLEYRVSQTAFLKPKAAC
jgi:hypothetical protein